MKYSTSSSVPDCVTTTSLMVSRNVSADKLLSVEISAFSSASGIIALSDSVSRLYVENLILPSGWVPPNVLASALKLIEPASKYFVVVLLIAFLKKSSIIIRKKIELYFFI